jgi:C1A family cysteine protease
MFDHDPDMPLAVDLRPLCPPIYDQSTEGACVAHAVAAAMEFDLMKVQHDIMLSRQFIYYNARQIENCVEVDNGCMLRDAIQSVAILGACPESEWTYNIDAFSIKPPDQAYTDGLKHKVIAYNRVGPFLNQMKGCLASGYPFAFGMMCYESFESEEFMRTGILSLPGANEMCYGGHCVLAVGFSDADQRFIIRNSWGSSFGMAGYFTIPFTYLLDPQLCTDFWTIKSVMVP